jgi:hypothetical protein
MLDPPEFTAARTADMIAHVERHIAAGQKVPTDLIPDLEADRSTIDAEIAAAG